jgi:hypothetical protein
MSKYIPYAIAWGVLAIVVIILAFMRRSVASHEDDTVHLTGDVDRALSEQAVTAKKLETIDKWGKSLTVILVVTGLVLGGLYGWDVFNATSTATFK